MPIKLRSEEVISFADAAKFCPKRQGGKRPDVSTIFRWSSRGIKGIVLEWLQVGGTRCTSKEAMQRFFDALTNKTDPRPRSQTYKNRQREIDRANRALDERGI